MNRKRTLRATLPLAVLAAFSLAGENSTLAAGRPGSVRANDAEPSPRSARQAPATTATPDALAAGHRILLAAATAAGGRALLGVKSLAMDESGQQFGARGSRALTVKWTVAYPDRARGDVTLGTQRLIQVCDGRRAWVVIGSQERDTTPVIAEFKRGIALFGGGWGLYREVLAGRISGRAIGGAEIDGKKTEGVAVHAAFGDVSLFFDTATHLLAAARFQTSTSRGMMQSEEHWSNYREVQGRQFAFSMATYRAGSKSSESTISTVKLNPPVQDSLFAKPQPAPAK